MGHKRETNWKFLAGDDDKILITTKGRGRNSDPPCIIWTKLLSIRLPSLSLYVTIENL